MTQWLNLWANKLFPFRRFFYSLVVLSILFIFYSLGFATLAYQDRWLNISLLFLLWLLLFNLLLHTFQGEKQLKEAKSWFAKLKNNFVQMLQKLLLIAVTLVTIAVFYVTFKMLNI